MRTIHTEDIKKRVREACGQMAHVYCSDILKALKEGRERETEERSVIAMDILLENAEIAEKEQIPICQDTGMVIAFITIGQDVRIEGGLLKQAVEDGVMEGYRDYYLRASVVSDPLFDRINTRTNTPAIIYTDITEGEDLVIELMQKGFGSENMSAVKMLKPAEGIEGVIGFVTDTIRKAGPNACPPMIVGVGIGGTFDYAAVLAKKALLHSTEEDNPNPRYAALEKELLKRANDLRIGPMGLHGKTTALKINIETYPTHIAGLPCAVNICCHACRHERLVF